MAGRIQQNAGRQPASWTRKVGNFEWLPGYLDGEDVFLVGGGGSLKDFDFSRLKGRKIIGLNYQPIEWKRRGVLKYSDISMLVFQDADISLRYPDLNNAPFKTVAFYCPPEPWGNVAVVPKSNAITKHPAQGVYGHYLSGLSAIHVAFLAGARKIYLLGFDGVGGRFYDQTQYKAHPIPTKWDRLIMKFDIFKPISDLVVNLNPDSAIKVFKKQPPETVL